MSREHEGLTEKSSISNGICDILLNGAQELSALLAHYHRHAVHIDSLRLDDTMQLVQYHLSDLIEVLCRYV